MPMSLLEALGHRRVCLVSDIPENKVDEENSYFFEHGNIESLRKALSEICADRKDYRPNGRLPGWREVADRTLAVYRGESPQNNE